MNKKALALAVLGTSSLILATPAFAQFELQGGWTRVAPQDVTSDSLNLDGANLPSRVDDISADQSYFIGLGYHFSPSLSVIASYTTGLEHDVKEKGLGLGTVGSFDLDVLTLVGQYTFNTEGTLQPYLQAGAIHARVDGEKPSASFVSNVGPASLSIDNATGWLAGAGLRYKLADNLNVFGEINYTGLETDAEYNVAGVSRLTADSVEVDPIVYRMGLGYRF